MQINRMKCCGLGEIHNLYRHTYHSDDDLLKSVGLAHVPWMKLGEIIRGDDSWDDHQGKIRARSYRMLYFSEARYPSCDPQGYGAKLVNLIQECSLGTVTVIADWAPNPNSVNLIKVWQWEIDHQAFWRAYAELTLKGLQAGEVKNYFNNIDGKYRAPSNNSFYIVNYQ